MDISDQELLNRLHNAEDAFVERKLLSDSDDWLKTAVAFANSCPIGFWGVLFVGVKDGGTIQDSENFESIQRKVAKKINEAFPQIYTLQRVLQRDGRTFLAVVIPGSVARPHFTGSAYLRQGSDNLPANQRLFDELIAQRNSKAYAILQWKNRQITAERRNVQNVAMVGEVAGYFEPWVEACDPHAVKLRTSDKIQTIPLDRVKIAHDDDRDRLKLELYPY